MPVSFNNLLSRYISYNFNRVFVDKTILRYGQLQNSATDIKDAVSLKL